MREQLPVGQCVASGEITPQMIKRVIKYQRDKDLAKRRLTEFTPGMSIEVLNYLRARYSRARKDHSDGN